MLLALLQAVTMVSADTGGIFYHRGPDTLRVANHTWVSRDSAPKLPDCVYSGRSQRMLARDSMRIVINTPREPSDYARRTRGDRYLPNIFVLRLGDDFAVDLHWPLPSGKQLHLLRVSAPPSVCGVNAGQVMLVWEIVP